MPLAVLPLRAEGLQLNEVLRLDALVRERGAVLGGYRVQTAAETTALLEAAQALGVVCDLGDPQCGGQIGVVAAVDRVIVGRAARVVASGDRPGGIGLELTLVEASTGAVLRHALVLLPDDPAAQTVAFDAVAQVLFGKDPTAPWLVLSGAQPGARVFVDGVDVGSLPLNRPLAGVVAGTHVVEVRASGHLPWHAVVRTTGSEPAVLDVKLVIDPTTLREVASPVQIGVAYGVAGLGVVLTAVGSLLIAGFSASFWEFEAKTKALADASATDPDYIGTVGRLNREAAAAEARWNAGDAQMTAVGVTVTSIGGLAALGGAVWGTVQLVGNEPSKPPAEPRSASGPVPARATGPAEPASAHVGETSRVP
jgi:hypothetical protein